MSHIYGCVKLTLTGPEEVMKRGLEVLKTVYIDDSCVSYIEGLVNNPHLSALRSEVGTWE